MNNGLTISTWIVIDEDRWATEFPSVGANSASPALQLVYWRCIILYFLTARIHNQNARLVLYSNVSVATVAPSAISRRLGELDVKTVHLPISFRLPQGSVSRWGNQFYVLDVIRHFAESGVDDALVLADSDCLWRRSVAPLEAAITEHRCLLYTLTPHDQKRYEVGRMLNGMTHARMAEIAHREFGLPEHHAVQYHGGEFFAASAAYCRSIQGDVDRLWRLACAEAALEDSIKEEAHFLSIIAEGHGIKPGTANPFVRRIWTNFEDVNVLPTDDELMIWHMPAEKSYGLKRLWLTLESRVSSPLSLDPLAINALTSRYMGIPRRSRQKLVLDVVEKLVNRIMRRGPRRRFRLAESFRFSSSR